MGEFVKVAKKSEIPSDTGKRVFVDGMEIALFKFKNKIHAIGHVCPHAGGPLAEGSLNEQMVMCPWHGWEFNVVTGQCEFNKKITVPVYKVKEDGDDVLVEV